MVILLSVIVLLVIILVVGYVMWPCSDRQGSFKPCQIDRYVFRTAVTDACRREGEPTTLAFDPIRISSRHQAVQRAASAYRSPPQDWMGQLPPINGGVASSRSLRRGQPVQINCQRVGERLVPLSTDRFSRVLGPLSGEAELILYRLLEVERRPLSLTGTYAFLPLLDSERINQILREESMIINGRGGTYPPRPWYVRWDVCGYDQNDDRRPRAGVFIDPERDIIECMSRENAARLYAEGARYWLLLGDAELSRTDVQCVWDSEFDGFCPGGYRDGYTYQRHGGFEPEPTALDLAMQNWRRASDWGRQFGAQASLMAQRRLQAHTVQCQSSPDGASLRRISRVGPDGIGEVIRLALRQRALTSLGYYSGPVDGYYGPETREAVRGFQRELGFDETGALSPRQTTLLICHSAQTAREASVQNTLGIMYATGLGVEQNTDLALEWLETAARRNDEDAYFNLAIIYGTGAVLGSYNLCGLVENFERAESYLSEAARLGHPIARRWRASPEYNRLPSPRARWEVIAERIRSAAIEGGGFFYLEWEDRHVRLPDIDLLPPGCLEAERFSGG
jgi:peptidoglycan hydrolase-like protein with peptidoglycan-binding domain